MLQKQNEDDRFTKKGFYLLASFLLVIFAVRYSILIQKSESDIWNLNQQFHTQGDYIRRTSNVKNIRPEKIIDTGTGSMSGVNIGK